jgi:hypothetical protein
MRSHDLDCLDFRRLRGEEEADLVLVRDGDLNRDFLTPPVNKEWGTLALFSL